jgi:hypothetical protein
MNLIEAHARDIGPSWVGREIMLPGYPPAEVLTARQRPFEHRTVLFTSEGRFDIHSGTRVLFGG